MASTADTLAETAERFRADPASAQVSGTVTARLADGRARIEAGNATFEADLPPMLGGNGDAPSPTVYLLGALAGCAVSFIASTLAPQAGVEIDDITATVRYATDLAGLLGVEGTSPELRDLAVDVAISSPSPPDRVAALQQLWTDRCPVYLALTAAIDVTVTFS
jgi:uncharacterized OsmC-like protein